jgi:triosephosphate isomerase
MSKRTPMIAGNWKMNMTVSESLGFITALSHELKAVGSTDVVIAPPYTALYSTGVALAETEFHLSAQNMHWEESGAFTGEISAEFLKDVGCEYVIIGHSERRQYFGETDEAVNKKIQAAMRHDLVPIFCVGERLDEREAGKTWEVIERQLTGGLSNVGLTDQPAMVVAYEPVWAIGTGKTATPAQAQEIHSMIRDHISESFNATVAENMRILYGGSVKPSNSRELFSQNDIDGGLVGGASLNPEHFAAIVRSAM